MVYSASIAIADAERFTGYQPSYFLVRHGVFLASARGRRPCVFHVPMRLWQQAAPWLFLFGAALLVLVLIPGIGREVNGSRRWIPLVVVNLQPSELMKLFVVLYAADYTVRKAAFMHSFSRGFLPMFAVMLFSRRAAAARARLRRIRGDHRDRDGHPVPGRDELAPVRGPGRCCW